MLLTNIKGNKSFADLYQVNGVTDETFKGC